MVLTPSRLINTCTFFLLHFIFISLVYLHLIFCLSLSLYTFVLSSVVFYFPSFIIIFSLSFLVYYLSLSLSRKKPWSRWRDHAVCCLCRCMSSRGIDAATRTQERKVAGFFAVCVLVEDYSLPSLLPFLALSGCLTDWLGGWMAGSRSFAPRLLFLLVFLFFFSGFLRVCLRWSFPFLLWLSGLQTDSLGG